MKVPSSSFAGIMVLTLTWTVALDAPASLRAQTTQRDAEYAPLWLYQGDWVLTPKSSAPNAKPDRIHNDCGRIGKFFACQQIVNGKIGSLIIFIPAEKPGHYYTQSVAVEGWAGGRGDLEINGDHWIYLGKDESNGKTTYYRTTNRFHGQGPDSL